ncbi:DNA polymerase III subunit gamma and tau [Microbacterium sp. RD1]|uniref:DNA polymerase III subunit gamma and tau n=1 Tax=Microbacterium sp. RD1 TaxID=3457313 RepID=UPI003FA55288
MTTALYRRYRPEAFGEMIGQSQVTDPLMTALRSDRVGHAYLFSGPRGCGKTTSARILARCLNCAAGPTDTPCGTCDSCVELGRGGGGSLDVVEIDAASHNGVDDARDLRERAIFAPARDRFKIFILDEAHMVTQQGFNALLKLVEEPPDHVKFIFATTEPEKVLGTIRSRTHHYPFRLVPPAAMLEYVQELCATEGVTVEPGVLPLVVRAGGGSPRDTLSLLDQLIAGSEAVAETAGGSTGTVTVRYERAVSLLGYTHAELLDEVVDAFGQGDAAAAFSAVDRVVQTGQDPRRFVDDLLERLRDLIVIAATGQGASAVLRGVPADELERMARQASVFGAARLSRTADLVIAALDEMTGATSPRLQLELLVARVLARAIGPAAEPAPAPAASASPSAPVAEPAQPATPVAERAQPATPVAERAQPAAPVPASAPVAEPAQTSAPVAERAQRDEAPAPEPAFAPPAPAGPLSTQRMRDAWPEVLARLETLSRTSWLVASGARVIDLDDDVLTLSFASANDLAAFKKRSAGAGPSEDLRQAILGILAIRVKFLAKHDGDGPGPGPGDAPAAPPPAPERRPATAASAAPVTEWAVAPIPVAADEPSPAGPPAALAQFAVDDEPEDAASAGARTATLAPVREGEILPDAPPAPEDDADEPDPDEPRDLPVPPTVAPPIVPPRSGVQRYGEAVVRQVLGATFVREEPHQSPTRFN